MEENVETHKKVISIPLALIIALIGISVIALSMYLPWWNMLDNTLGPLKTIYLYKSTTKFHLEIQEYVWAVRDPILKTAMLYPFLLMTLSLTFSIINLFHYKMKKKKAAGIFALISSATSITSFLVFTTRFETYMEGMNETIAGSVGYLHWGYGLGWKLSLVATALMIIAGLLQLLQTGYFEFEVVFEKETEAA